MPASEWVKLKYSAYSAVVFLLMSAPGTYSFVQAYVGRMFTVASRNGAPTAAGLALHTCVFLFIVFGLMHMRI